MKFLSGVSAPRKAIKRTMSVIIFNFLWFCFWPSYTFVEREAIVHQDGLKVFFRAQKMRVALRCAHCPVPLTYNPQSTDQCFWRRAHRVDQQLKDSISLQRVLIYHLVKISPRHRKIAWNLLFSLKWKLSSLQSTTTINSTAFYTHFLCVPVWGCAVSSRGCPSAHDCVDVVRCHH